MENYYKESTNTLKAKWYMLLLARIFGKKTVGIDSDAIVTIYTYRGVSYLIDFERY